MNRGGYKLLELAALLDTVPPDRFNYGVYVEDDWKGAPDLSCGTRACALGWATTIPAWRKAGLHLVAFAGGGAAVHYGDCADPTEAAAKFFEISRREAYYLFFPDEAPLFFPDEASPERRYPRSPPSNATPHDVAEHIRKFVAERYEDR